MLYSVYMNQKETNVFFRLLHSVEDELGGQRKDTPDYIEGYDYIMDIVKDAIFEGYDVKNMYDLDNFINQADAYSEDYDGDYADGYQDAVNICLEAVGQLIGSEEA